MTDVVDNFVTSSASQLCDYMLDNSDEKTRLQIEKGMQSCAYSVQQYGISGSSLNKIDQTGEFSVDESGWFSLRHKDGRMWYKGLAHDSVVLGFNVEKPSSETGHCMQKPVPSMLLFFLLSAIMLTADYFLPIYLGWPKVFCNFAVLGGAFIVGFVTIYFLISLSDGDYINPFLTTIIHLLAWSPLILWNLLQCQLYVWAGYLVIALLTFLIWRQRKWIMLLTVHLADIALFLKLLQLIPLESDPSRFRLLVTLAISVVAGFFTSMISIRTSIATWRFDAWSPFFLNVAGFTITFTLLFCLHSILFFYYLSETIGIIAVLTFVTIVMMLLLGCWVKLIEYGWLDSFMGVGNDLNVLCICMVLLPGLYVDCVTILLMEWELWAGLLYSLGLTIACLFLGWSICDAFQWSSDLACSIAIFICHLAIALIVVCIDSLLWKLVSFGGLVGCGFISCIVLCCCSRTEQDD